MSKSPSSIALDDISAATARYSLVGMLGWQDLRQRYRRSVLGPFWLTLSMGIMIGTIGAVFGLIFNSPMKEFWPFLTIGMILWGFITAMITEGCTGFIAAEGIIKQLPIPLFVHILRLTWRNVLILAHNIVIFPLVLLIVGKPLGWVALVSIGGFAVMVLNMVWMALLLGIICARYRDLPQIISSGLLVVFYVTPIMWMPKLLPKGAGQYLLTLNPFYDMLEIVRAPLLGQMPPLSNWAVSIGVAVIGWGATLSLYGLYKRRIAYWL